MNERATLSSSPFELPPSVAEEIAGLSGPIVVLGAGGFIGAAALRVLAAHRPDCYGVTHQSFVPWRLVGLPPSNVITCDIRDPDAVARLFARLPFRTVFFFAAYGAYARQSEARTIYETNVLGLLNVLDAAEHVGLSAFVHAGSSSEYGLNCAGPSEDALLEPNSHYAVSKIAAANLLRFKGTVGGLPTINLRLYSVYGPYEEPDRLVPRLVAAAASGDFPPLVDPEISRDFVFVSDVVEACVIAASRGVKTAPGRSINICTGKKTTIREIVQTAKDVFQIPKEPTWGQMQNRAWDLREWYGNPALAEKILGWRAHTELRDGLLRTQAWMKESEKDRAPAELVPVPRPKRLSAIIACYRDAQAIPIMHERLTKAFVSMGVDYEILFVNDGSPDDTNAVLAALCSRDQHVIAIEHSRNFGSQSAFLSGMQLASGDAVIILDGDLQDPPELIPAFFEKWCEGYEVVYGRRVRREATPFLQIAYRAFYRVFRNLAAIPIPLDAGDFSLLDAKVVRQLVSLPETDQFIRGLRAWVGFKQTGVDYHRPERMFGVTTNNLRKNLGWARKGIFSFSFAPLEFLTYAGWIITAVAFLALIGQIAYRLFRPNIPHGVTTIIVLVLFFGGLQLLASSILGEYIGKILEESKQRPKFIRRSIRANGRQLVAAEELEAFIKTRSQHGPS
jgi:dolichol-phosphate mannosyltransferase